MGYNVIGMISSGEEVLNIIENNEIDLIFMDIQLKGELDGIDTAMQIRKSFDIPIVYTTANSDLKTHKKIEQTEPYEYLIKPFDDTQLQIAINNSLNFK